MAFSSAPPKIIYLDYQATTPPDPRVIDEMLPWLLERHGNPHVTMHRPGKIALDAIEKARAQVADLIGADTKEIIFTSSATEAANIAIRSFGKGKSNHMVTSAIEHSCVRETMADLKRNGLHVTVVKVSADGLIEPSDLERELNGRTKLVAIMSVNNEIGVIQPISEIGASCRGAGVPFFSDGAQAAGKIPIDVDAVPIDLMSIASHKLYGPPGIGALYCRAEIKPKLSPLMTGGGQEAGLRPGTLPTALCVGFGCACAIAKTEMKAENEHLTNLRDRFLGRILSAVDGIQINGSLENRIPGNLNLSIGGIPADVLLARLPDLAISTASACHASALEPSHVLTALGLDHDMAFSSIRIGFGRNTTLDEIDYAVTRLADEIIFLRQHV